MRELRGLTDWQRRIIDRVVDDEEASVGLREEGDVCRIGRINRYGQFMTEPSGTYPRDVAEDRLNVMNIEIARRRSRKADTQAAPEGGAAPEVEMRLDSAVMPNLKELVGSRH